MRERSSTLRTLAQHVINRRLSIARIDAHHRRVDFFIPGAFVMEGTVLQSWKEIAQYAGRGVRTVQRWEAFGLPVRRPSGHDRSAVLALKSEVDAWLRRCARREPTFPLAQADDGSRHRVFRDFNPRLRDLQEKVRLAQIRSSEVLQSAQALREHSALRHPKVA